MLDQVVNAVGLTIWSMLISLATWSMMGGGVGGIDMSTEILSVVDCSVICPPLWLPSAMATAEDADTGSATQ